MSFLEGRMVEQSHMLGAIQDAITGLDRRMTSLEQKLDSKIDAIDLKLDQRFAWLMGIQLTTALALLAAMIALAKH